MLGASREEGQRGLMLWPVICSFLRKLKGVKLVNLMILPIWTNISDNYLKFVLCSTSM